MLKMASVARGQAGLHFHELRNPRCRASVMHPSSVQPGTTSCEPGCSSRRCGSFDELQQQGLQPSGITYSDYEPGELLTIF